MEIREIEDRIREFYDADSRWKRQDSVFAAERAKAAKLFNERDQAKKNLLPLLKALPGPAALPVGFNSFVVWDCHHVQVVSMATAADVRCCLPADAVPVAEAVTDDDGGEDEGEGEDVPSGFATTY